MNNDTTTAAIGPIETALNEIKDLYAELSELQVDINVTKRLSDDLLQKERSVENCNKLCNMHVRCEQLKQRCAALQTQYMEWGTRTRQLIANLEYAHITESELRALMELNEYTKQRVQQCM